MLIRSLALTGGFPAMFILNPHTIFAGGYKRQPIEKLISDNLSLERRLKQNRHEDIESSDIWISHNGTGTTIASLR